VINSNNTNSPKKKPFWLKPLFWLMVVIPTLLATFYYFYVASDIYITESKFVIRSPQKSSTGSVNDLFARVGFASSGNDSFVVRDYILSRPALATLNEKLNIKDKFSDKQIDFLHRFPGWQYWDTSMVAFYEYYLKRVGVIVDSGASISSLTVQAFTPQTSLETNQELLKMSEAFVNQLNTRAGKDLISNADQEVTLAQNKLETLSIRLVQEQSYPRQKISPEQQLVLVQRLILEKEFAVRQLSTAMTSLEQARVEAMRQQVYLERVAEPVLPDSSTEPRRLRGVLTIFLLGLVFWGIATLLISGAREHND
jgi:capsular polysaccharide transport system permease protein